MSDKQFSLDEIVKNSVVESINEAMTVVRDMKEPSDVLADVLLNLVKIDIDDLSEKIMKSVSPYRVSQH